MSKFYASAKKPVCFTLILFVATTLSAQWRVGVEGGYALNAVSSESSFAYTRKYVSRSGYYVGVPVRYCFSRGFAVQSGLEMIQKNYGIRREGNRYGRFYSDITNTYLQLPVTASVSFGKKRLRVFLNGGVYMGAWLSSRIKGIFPLEFAIDEKKDIHAFNEKVPFDRRRDNRFEAGLLAGTGLKWALNDWIDLSVEAKFLYGLTDLQRQYMRGLMPRYNTTWTFGLGAAFRLPLPEKR